VPKTPVSLHISLLLILAVASECRVPAQDLPAAALNDFLDPQHGLTEADLVARALASNPTLTVDRGQIGIAQGNLAQARLRKNPSLSLDGLKEVNGDDHRFGIGGTMPLELFARRARRTEVAERNLDFTRDTVSDKERLLTGQVGTLFGEALAAVRNLGFAEQLLEANRNFLKLLEDRVREGATPSLDADELRVEVNRVDAQRVDAQAKAEVALLALKEMANMQPEEQIHVRGSLELPVRSFDSGELLQLAAAHRPDLAAQRASESLAAADLHQQQILGKPDASLSVSYQRPNSGFAQQALDSAGVLRPIRQSFNYAVFGLDINLPVFNRNQGAIAADAAAISSARSRIVAVNLALRHEVAQNLIRYNSAQATITVYRDGVRNQAAKNLGVVRQTYRYGRNTLLDVIAEQRRYIDIEIGYTGVLANAYAARVALEQSIGTTLP